MPYQPTYPSPYMETIDVKKTGGNTFKCLINPKDTVQSAKIKIYKNKGDYAKRLYDAYIGSSAGYNIVNIPDVGREMFDDLYLRIRNNEKLGFNYAGVHYHISKVSYDSNNNKVSIHISPDYQAADSPVGDTISIYTNVVREIDLSSALFPFIGDGTDNSWLECVIDGEGLTNGEDYKWSISLNCNDYDIVSNAGVFVTPKDSTGSPNVYVVRNPELENSVKNLMNSGINCYITINHKKIKIVSIGSGYITDVNGKAETRTFIKLDSSIESYPTDEECVISTYSSIVQSPEYYFKARTEPLVTFDVPETIDSSTYTFNATYFQEQYAGIAYFEYSLYSYGELIASSGQVFSQKIFHTFNSIVEGTEYTIVLHIVDNNGIEITEERTFVAEYDLLQSIIAPVIEIDNNSSCARVDFSNNAVIPSTLTGADSANFEIFGDQDYDVISSGNVISYSSPSITISPCDTLMSHMAIKIGEEMRWIESFSRNEDGTIDIALDSPFETEVLAGTYYEICSYYNGIHLDENQSILWDNINDNPLIFPDRSTQVIHWHGVHSFNGVILEKTNSEFTLGGTVVSYDGEKFICKMGTLPEVHYSPYIGTANAVAGYDEYSTKGIVQEYLSSTSIVVESADVIQIGSVIQIGNECRIITDVVVDDSSTTITIDREFENDRNEAVNYVIYDENYQYILDDSQELLDTDILIDNDLINKYWWLIVLLPNEIKVIKTVPFIESEV